MIFTFNINFLTVIIFLFFSISSKNVFAKEEGLGSFSLEGSFMVDYESFGGVHGDDSSVDQLKFRRSSLSAGYDYEKWKSKLKVAYDESEDKFKLKDAYISYKFMKFSRLTLGKHKEPFGMEYSTSSKAILALERSLPSDAFSTGRNYGLSVRYLSNDYGWNVGVFDASDDDDFSGVYAFTGTTYFSRSVNENANGYLGFSASIRNGDDKQSRIKESSEVYSADEIAKSSKLHVDTVSQYGLALSFNADRLFVQSEFFYQDVNVKPDRNDFDSSYSGYYVQSSYLLNSGKWAYKKGKYQRKKIKPYSWELVARYSSLDAFDNAKGTNVENVLLGLNFYFNKKVRIMTNFISTTAEGSDILNKESGHAVSVRGQYTF